MFINKHDPFAGLITCFFFRILNRVELLKNYILALGSANVVYFYFFATLKI